MKLSLPHSWSQVTIETFIKYYTISTRKWENPIDCEINILSCFSGLPTSEIETLKHGEFVGYLKELAFLKELPQTKVHSHFTLKNSRFKACLLMSDMTAGQFMNFSDILKGVKPEDYVYEMHKLLGAMCVQREYQMSYPFIKYNYKGYMETSDVFYKHMTIDVAYPYYVFFCKVMEKSLPAIQSYLNRELNKLKKSSQKRKWGFRSIGGGIVWSTPSQTTT